MKEIIEGHSHLAAESNLEAAHTTYIEERNRIHETQHDRTNMDKHLTTNLYYGDPWLDQVWYLDTTVTSNVAGRLQSFVHVYPVRKGLTSMSVTSLKGFLLKTKKCSKLHSSCVSRKATQFLICGAIHTLGWDIFKSFITGLL